MDDNNLSEFECRTSLSNPQAQLTLFRQSNDGQKHFDIQYKTSSLYKNGINSIKFMVYFLVNFWLLNYLLIRFSYLELIVLFMKIF